MRGGLKKIEKLIQLRRCRASVAYPTSSAGGRSSCPSVWQCRESHKHLQCKSFHVNSQAEGPAPDSQSSISAGRLSCPHWWTLCGGAPCLLLLSWECEDEWGSRAKVKVGWDRWEQAHTAALFLRTDWLTDCTAAVKSAFSSLYTHWVGVSTCCQSTYSSTLQYTCMNQAAVQEMHIFGDRWK